MSTQTQLGLITEGNIGHGAKLILERIVNVEMYRCKLDDGHGEEKIIAIAFPETMSESMFFWLIESAAQYHKIPVVKGNF